MEKFSRHAEHRIKGRAIAPFVVDLILNYGHQVNRGGAEVSYLTRAGRRQLVKDLGQRIYARIADQLDVYVVHSNGTIITAAKRLDRIRH